MRKKTYLLLELLIALSLLSILLTSLFSFLAQQIKVEEKMANTRRLILERQQLQVRLQDLFTSLDTSEESPTIYTTELPKEKKRSLIFIFHAGVDPDPAFSGELIGKIYCDKQDRLIFTRWPLQPQARHLFRSEILLSNIADFSFSFLGTQYEVNPKISSLSAEVGWHPHWRKERGDVPILIRLSLTQKGESSPLRFAFRLPVKEPVITYGAAT